MDQTVCRVKERCFTSEEMNIAVTKSVPTQYLKFTETKKLSYYVETTIE